MSTLRTYITSVRLLLNHKSKLRSYLSITLNGDFAVKGIRYIQTDDNEFFAMPQRGPGVDVAFPTTRASRARLTAVLKDAYERAAASGPAEGTWVAIDDPADPAPKGIRTHFTSVRIKPHLDGKLRAFVNLTLNHDFAVKSVRLIQGRDRLFVAMPQRDRRVDLAHTTTPMARKQLTLVTIDAYHRAVQAHGKMGDWFAVDDPIDPAIDELHTAMADGTKETSDPSDLSLDTPQADGKNGGGTNGDLGDDEDDQDPDAGTVFAPA